MLAACDNPVNPVVSGEVAEWCIEYVLQRGEAPLRYCHSSGENDYQQTMNSSSGVRA